MDILLAIAILSFLVLIHEFGHYIVAKKSGVHVEEFGIGYPPRAKVLFHHKETIFSLNWLPFGGFVRLAGDDAETFEKSPSAAVRSAVLAVERLPGLRTITGVTHLFNEKSKLVRLCVVYAGPLMNLLLGVVIFASIYTVVGLPVQLPHPRVEVVMPKSPAELAGVQVGETLVSIDGEEVRDAQMFIDVIGRSRGKDVSLVIESGVEKEPARYTARVHVRSVEETPSGEGGIGVQLSDTELRFYPWWQMPFRGMAQGIQDSFLFAKMVLVTFYDMIHKAVTVGKMDEAVSGPIGIVYTVKKEKLFEHGLIAALNFTALISINLGVMNMLPIPALDGGRAFFVLLETIIGKKRRAQWEQYANSAGMIVLLAFIVLISVRDVWRIVIAR